MKIKEPGTGRDLVSIYGNGDLYIHARDALQVCAPEHRALVKFLMRLPSHRRRLEILALEDENAQLMTAVCKLNEELERLR